MLCTPQKSTNGISVSVQQAGNLRIILFQVCIGKYPRGSCTCIGSSTKGRRIVFLMRYRAQQPHLTPESSCSIWQMFLEQQHCRNTRNDWKLLTPQLNVGKILLGWSLSPTETLTEEIQRKEKTAKNNDWFNAHVKPQRVLGSLINYL